MLTRLHVFAALLLASSACAKPVNVFNEERAIHVPLPFSKHINQASLLGMAARNRHRASHLSGARRKNSTAAAGSASGSAASGSQSGAAAASDSGDSEQVALNDGSAYVAQVQVGNPPQTFSLLIDTGSSNTWVGAQQNNPFNPSSTTQDTGNQFTVSYGSGSVQGEEVIEQISMGDGLTIKQQSMGVAQQAQGFQDVDGILGIGPNDLTKNTIENTQTADTVTDNLFSSGVIKQNLVAVSFAPSTDPTAQNGELTFGATDSSKFIGNITFTPITQTSPASNFWGIDQKVSYNGQEILASSGIVDTGTTLLLLATDAFDKYKAATGAVEDQQTGLLKVSAAQAAKLQNLDLEIQGQTFSLTPDAQTLPRALNEGLGGNADDTYLVISDLGTQSGQGLDFINGLPFLERFYSVFDTTNRQVGIANTQDTNAVINNPN